MGSSVPVACGPIHQVSVTGSQALHRVLHPRDEQVLCILAPDDNDINDDDKFVSSSHVRSPVFGRGAQVIAQLVGVVGVEEDLGGCHDVRQHVLPAHTLPPENVT